jgi:sulfur carrier protein ThiS
MRISYRDEEWKLEGRRRVREVIEKVGLNPHTVLAVRGGKLLTEDIVLEEDDDLQLVAVISGG